MRNIDRLRSMSLEEITPYLVHRTVIDESDVWYSPNGYIYLAIKMLQLTIAFIG